MKKQLFPCPPKIVFPVPEVHIRLSGFTNFVYFLQQKKKSHAVTTFSW